jgi:hypothetical protein
MENNNIHDFVKEKLIKNEMVYPEKLVYEKFLMFNALLYFKPENCSFHYSKFGISVIPDIFDNEVHSELKLTMYIINENQTTRTEKNSQLFLPNHIYLHNLVKERWAAEKNNYQILFEIEVIRKVPELIFF